MYPDCLSDAKERPDLGGCKIEDFHLSLLLIAVIILIVGYGYLTLQLGNVRNGFLKICHIVSPLRIDIRGFIRYNCEKCARLYMSEYELVSIWLASGALGISFLHIAVSIVKWLLSRNWLGVIMTVCTPYITSKSNDTTEFRFIFSNRSKPFSINNLTIKSNNKEFGVESIFDNEFTFFTPQYFATGESKLVSVLFKNEAVADEMTLIIETNTKIFKSKLLLKSLQQQD